MLKAPAMILGVKGPSNQHCIGGGGGMREFAVFLLKCPKTFGKDCRNMIKCPLTRGVRLREVSVSGGSTVFMLRMVVACVSR